MVVTDLLLLSSIVVSGVSISIITDAKNARRYHRGGLVVVAARRSYVLLLLSSLFQQFQLSAQARRLGEPMEKLTHWDDAISTRPSLLHAHKSRFFCERLDSSFSGREKQKEVRFMYRETRRLGFSSRRVVLRARKESLSLSLSLSPFLSALCSLTNNELFFCPSFRVFDVFYYLGFQY